MSTSDPELWLRQQDQNASMRELWPVLLREAWEERHDLALGDIDSVTLNTLLRWSAANDPEFSAALVALVEGVHESAPSDADHAELRRTNAEDALKKLAPGASDARSKLLGKIQHIADDRGLDLLDLLTEAKASSNLLSFIQKNATKGMNYEKTASAYIELHRPAVRVLRLADRATKLSIRFDKEGKAYVNIPANNDKYSKDADLAAVHRTGEGVATVYLVSHKFARIGGGHQDNQWADASQFLDYASHSTSSAVPPHPQLQGLVRKALEAPDLVVNWRPALILDGDFFVDAPSKMSGMFDGHPCFVGDTDAFIRHIDSLNA